MSLFLKGRKDACRKALTAPHVLAGSCAKWGIKTVKPTILPELGSQYLLTVRRTWVRVRIWILGKEGMEKGSGKAKENNRKS